MQIYIYFFIYICTYLYKCACALAFFVLASTRAVLAFVTHSGPVYNLAVFEGWKPLRLLISLGPRCLEDTWWHMPLEKETPSCRFSLQSIHWLEHTIFSQSMLPGHPIFCAGCNESRYKDQPGWEPTRCTIENCAFTCPKKMMKHDSSKKAMVWPTKATWESSDIGVRYYHCHGMWRSTSCFTNMGHLNQRWINHDQIGDLFGPRESRSLRQVSPPLMIDRYLHRYVV